MGKSPSERQMPDHRKRLVSCFSLFFDLLNLKPLSTMGQNALRAVRHHSHHEARSKHQDDLAVDRLTAVPTDVYTEFLAAGKAARRRGQHRQYTNKDGVNMLRCSESREIVGPTSHSVHAEA